MRRSKTPEPRTAQAAAATQRFERRERLKLATGIAGKAARSRRARSCSHGWWSESDALCVDHSSIDSARACKARNACLNRSDTSA